MTKLDCFSINTRKLAYEIIDNEVLIVDFNSGNYYSLNAVGVDIWKLLEKNAALKDIIEQITGKYQGDAGRISEEVTELIRELNREELIVPIESESGGCVTDLYRMSKTERNEGKIPFEKPTLSKYTDMREMLLLDPIHEVDEMGWPITRRDQD